MPADPLGRAMYDYHHGERTWKLVYRDGDDVKEHDIGATYFTPPDAWSEDWKQRLDALDDPILDIGCGPGTHSLWLQERGREVVAIDVSPNAVRAARERGLRTACVMDLFHLGVRHGRFRSVIVIGTQLGLGGSLSGVRAILADLGAVTGRRATAIVDSYDPASLDSGSLTGFRPDPRLGVAHRAFHFEYHRPGDGRDGPEVGRTLSFVLFGPDRLRDIVVGTPWEVTEVVTQDGYYRAWLEK